MNYTILFFLEICIAAGNDEHLNAVSLSDIILYRDVVLNENPNPPAMLGRIE